MKQIILSMAILFAVVFNTACPKASVVKRATKASSDIIALVDAGLDATRAAYLSGAISLAQKDFIAQRLKVIAQSDIEFNAQIKLLSNAPSQTQTQLLNLAFSDKMVAPFLEILKSFAGARISDNLRLIIASIQAALLTISAVFTTRTAQINQLKTEAATV